MKRWLQFILLLLVCALEARGEQAAPNAVERQFNYQWFMASKAVLSNQYFAGITFQEMMNRLGRESERGNAAAEELFGICLFLKSDSQEKADAALHLIRDSAEKGYVPAMVQLGYLYIGKSFVARDDKEVFHWFSVAAEKGDPEAELELGSCYGSAIGTTQNLALAANWFRRSAEQTNYVAMKSLGYYLMNGFGVKKDTNAAKAWFLRSANEGNNPRAMYDLGVMAAMQYPNTNAMAESFRWYWKSANLGDSLACLTLAQFYYNGWGAVKTNLESYRYWINRAAELGSTEGEYKMGVAYREGDEVPQNAELSLKWYQRAAAKNHPYALYDLAIYYWQSRTNRTSVMLADNYMLRAASVGHREAQFQYAMMAFRGDVYVPDFEKGKKWLVTSAESGWSKAEFLLYRLYAYGMSPAPMCPAYPQDKAEALSWLSQAASHENLQAEDLLAIALIQGNGIKKDNLRAERLLRNAAEHGNATAENDLGYAMMSKAIVSPDPVEPAKWCWLAMSRASETNIQNIAGANFTNAWLRLTPEEQTKAGQQVFFFRPVPVLEPSPMTNGWEQNPSYRAEGLIQE